VAVARITARYCPVTSEIRFTPAEAMFSWVARSWALSIDGVRKVRRLRPQLAEME